MSGEFKGEDSHFTLKGLLASFVGADPEQGMEVIVVGGESYVRGPVPLLGATEDKWYILEGEQGSVAEPPVQTDDLFSSFAGSDADLSQLESQGTEELDGQQCTVYGADREATIELIQSSDPESLPFGAPEDVEDAQIKIWICEDGLLHQLQFSMEGTDQDTQQEMAFDVLLHITEFNGDVTITAPEDAEPLQGFGS